VVRVINVGDEGELARCQLALGRKKALVARFRGEAGKQGGQCGMVVSSNLPERDPRSIGDHQALGSRC